MVTEESTIQRVIKGANSLSLGISMVVAVAMGVGIGLLLRDWFGVGWLLWLGVFWGFAAALLNVYKAYKKEFKECEDLASNPRYAHQKDEKNNH